MAENQTHLLTTRRFLPLFLTQFLGALNDNIFKNALVILITYRVSGLAGMSRPLLVTLAAGLFILPFFLFSATAGKLADRQEKSWLIRWIKIAEIIIMAAGAAGFLAGNITFLLFVLFLMGIHSAFFGPLKYAILPDHLRENELIPGNALIESATFLAIILGTLAGSLLILVKGGAELIGFLVLAVAATGYLASRFIPPTPRAAPGLGISINFWRETCEIMANAAKRPDIFRAIIGISWFWFLGATYLAQFPNYARSVAGGNQQVVALFLVAFAAGIALGSMMCNRLLRGIVTARYTPIAALAITIFTIDLYFALRAPGTGQTQLIGAAAFLKAFAHVRVLADFTLIAVAGGIYAVPLYALIQDRSEPAHRSRMIAGLNVMNALFMVASAVLTMLLLASGFSVRDIFLITGLANLGAVFYLRKFGNS